MVTVRLGLPAISDSMKAYLLLIFCLISGVFADDSWDDFTNNLATDLVRSQHEEPLDVQ